jgi:hypothetical protein
MGAFCRDSGLRHEHSPVAGFILTTRHQIDTCKESATILSQRAAHSEKNRRPKLSNGNLYVVYFPLSRAVGELDKVFRLCCFYQSAQKGLG